MLTYAGAALCAVWMTPADDDAEEDHDLSALLVLKLACFTGTKSTMLTRKALLGPQRACAVE
jgi:hypothetical protein